MNRIVRFKCNVAGASGVGKTTFLDVATTGRFNPSYSCTIGASMIPSKSTIRGETIMLNFWDTGGQERFRAIVSIFFRDTDCCLFFYNVNDINSFLELKNWIEMSLEMNQEKFPGYIIGTHVDLERRVSQHDAMELAQKHGFAYEECCCKDKAKVDDIMHAVVLELADRQPKLLPEPPVNFLQPQREDCCVIV